LGEKERDEKMRCDFDFFDLAKFDAKVSMTRQLLPLPLLLTLSNSNVNKYYST